jgi:DNA-binding PadR family transcriptional regulator
MDKFRPESFLPLTPVAFEILLALADGERHGYSILQEVETRSGGAVSLHAGTLYRALARLLESDLIEELRSSPDPSSDDERRRYYRLTSRGVAVARAEVGRLEGQLAAARTRRLLKRRSRVKGLPLLDHARSPTPEPFGAASATKCVTTFSRAP